MAKAHISLSVDERIGQYTMTLNTKRLLIYAPTRGAGHMVVEQHIEIPAQEVPHFISKLQEMQLEHERVTELARHLGVTNGT